MPDRILICSVDEFHREFGYLAPGTVLRFLDELDAGASPIVKPPPGQWFSVSESVDVGAEQS